MLRRCNTCESGNIAVADYNPDLRYVSLVDEVDKSMKSICADRLVDCPLLVIHSQPPTPIYTASCQLPQAS